MKRASLVILVVALCVFFMTIPGKAQQLSADKLFEIIGRLQVQVTLLTEENAALKEALKALQPEKEK